MTNRSNTDWASDAGTPVLRVEFSELVDVDTLTLLHSEGLSEKVRFDFRMLMESAQIERVIKVYDLSPDEIAHDTYGFARDFKCILCLDADWHSSLNALRQSPLVHRAQPLAVRGRYE